MKSGWPSIFFWYVYYKTHFFLLTHIFSLPHGFSRKNPHENQYFWNYCLWLANESQIMNAIFTWFACWKSTAKSGLVGLSNWINPGESNLISCNCCKWNETKTNHYNEFYSDKCVEYFNSEPLLLRPLVWISFNSPIENANAKLMRIDWQHLMDFSIQFGKSLSPSLRALNG